MFIYASSTFLTSTAFVSTNVKYGIPLSRYTVYLQNYPLGYSPIALGVLEQGKVTQNTTSASPRD